MYDFDYVFDRRNTEVIKWDRLAAEYGQEGLLPFGIADMDFQVLPKLRQAMEARAGHPTYGYTYPSEEYYNSFIRWNQKRNQFVIKKEEILSVPGIVCACSFIIYALTEPGDKILINTPIYDPFFNVIRQQKREVATSPLVLKDGRYQVDFEDFEEKLRSGVKLFILCNPHNPVGRVWTREELSRMVRLCAKYQVKIFSDEIHSDLIYPEHKHIPILEVSPEAEKLSLLAMAPSKTFNIAGLKSSMLVARDSAIRDKVGEALQAFHVGVNLFGLKASETAYQFGEEWADELVDYLYDNAKLVDGFMKGRLPRVKTYVPDGTYLMWLDFSDYGFSQEQLMKRMAEEAKVALNDGEHYGEEGRGFVRMNIATQRAMLLEGLERIKKAF